MTSKISTLIVDDTVTYRKILSDAVAGFPELEIAGTAPSGSIALKKMAQNPVQLVFLDVFMPDLDGIQTLERIRSEFPSVSVVMISGISTKSAESTIRALEMGAVDFIRKPDGPNAEENFSQLKNDIRAVLRLVQLKLAARGTAGILSPAMPKPGTMAPEPPRTSAAIPASFGIIAIGVSTGGPEALNKIIPQLPGDLGVPIVLVQHMPPVFTKSLADSLAKKSKLRVVEAEDGVRLEPNVAYIAPGGRHMVVRKADGTLEIGLNDEPAENSCRPSVDVLFRSVASVCGDKGILACILTGMGSDGLNGVRAMKRKGCYCLSQSAGTCVVYGMPRAIDEAGLSDKSVPVEEIAGEITRLIKK
jgi:two-component system, chemotaxis family, protein-glutamate methylesterase/glutaminase